jgi:hypothetical protein
LGAATVVAAAAVVVAVVVVVVMSMPNVRKLKLVATGGTAVADGVISAAARSSERGKMPVGAVRNAKSVTRVAWAGAAA